MDLLVDDSGSFSAVHFLYFCNSSAQIPSDFSGIMLSAKLMEARTLAIGLAAVWSLWSNIRQADGAAAMGALPAAFRPAGGISAGGPNSGRPSGGFAAGGRWEALRGAWPLPAPESLRVQRRLGLLPRRPAVFFRVTVPPVRSGGVCDTGVGRKQLVLFNAAGRCVKIPGRACAPDTRAR